VTPDTLIDELHSMVVELREKQNEGFIVAKYVLEVIEVEVVANKGKLWGYLAAWAGGLVAFALASRAVGEPNADLWVYLCAGPLYAGAGGLVAWGAYGYIRLRVQQGNVDLWKGSLAEAKESTARMGAHLAEQGADMDGCIAGCDNGYVTMANGQKTNCGSCSAMTETAEPEATA